MRWTVLLAFLFLGVLLVACGADGGKMPTEVAEATAGPTQAKDDGASVKQVVNDLPTPPPQPTAITIPTFPPAVGSALPGAQYVEPPRRLDPEINPLGVKVESPELAPGDRYWRAVAIQWHDPQEAAYRHYVWVRTRDKNGKPTAGQAAIFKWSSGQNSAPTPVDFPMYAAGHSYAVWIDDGIPSEKVTGMGLGTPSSRHTTDHVEYFVTFQVSVRGK